jgi:hypothetical protein
MKQFLNSNDGKYRLARTILQGIIGVLIANVDLLIEPLSIPMAYKPIVVALVMAILSPIMAELGQDKGDPVEFDDDDLFDDDLIFEDEEE